MKKTMLENKEQVKEIIMKPTAHIKCRIGQDWYGCRFVVVFTPTEYYPDYSEVQQFVMEYIDGQELNIEEAARILYDFLKEYDPEELIVTETVEDCKTHFDVEVTIYE